MSVRDWQLESSPEAAGAWSSTLWRHGSESGRPGGSREPDARPARSDLGLQREATEGLLMAALRDAAAAREATAAMLAFLGRVSHEMRTPLNVIVGFVDLMDMEVHGPVTAKQRADLGCIRESERQLLVMIDDLLDFLKVQSGQVTHRSVDVPVRGLLTGVLTLMEPLLKEKGLRSGEVVCGPAVTVRADPDRVRQILLNLLTNAIKFTPAGGEIELVGEDAGDIVHIRVTDSGAGIAAERIEAVFKPFVQVANGLTGPKQGVGLGLAISRDLARAMRGDLTVVSAIDVGSQFTLTLPRG